MLRDRAAAPGGRRAHALLRRVPDRVGGRARLRPPRLERHSACSSPASPAAASRRSGRGSRRAGARRVTEAMGIGDIGVVALGRVRAAGRHAPRRARLRPRRADRSRDGRRPIALEDGATGELVLTHLRHRAAPLLRFRTRDHVHVRTSPCACGRTGPRVRCIGRTDDMLIVRGVNVFPSAVREVVSAFVPAGQRQHPRQARGRRASSRSRRCRSASSSRATRSRTSRARGRRSVRDCAACSSCRPASSSCRGGACSAASTSRSSSSIDRGG